MAHRSRRRYLGGTGAAAHVPRSRRTPRTCYRDTGVLDESGAVKGDCVLLTHCRRRRRGWRTRYRGVGRAGAVTVAIAVAIGGADGGACRTAGSGAKHGVVPVRQQRRQWAGQQCRRPCAGLGAARDAPMRSMVQRRRVGAVPAAGAAGQGERGAFADERGAQCRREETVAVRRAVCAYENGPRRRRSDDMARRGAAVRRRSAARGCRGCGPCRRGCR